MGGIMGSPEVKVDLNTILPYHQVFRIIIWLWIVSSKSKLVYIKIYSNLLVVHEKHRMNCLEHAVFFLKTKGIHAVLQHDFKGSYF